MISVLIGILQRLVEFFEVFETEENLSFEPFVGEGQICSF